MTDEFCSTNLFNFSNFLSDLGCFDEILESFILFVPTFKKYLRSSKGNISLVELLTTPGSLKHDKLSISSAYQYAFLKCILLIESKIINIPVGSELIYWVGF